MFMEPTEYLFSFNNPIGACPVCEGYSKIIGIDENLVIPDQNLSVYEDAIACWKGETMRKWKERLIAGAEHFDFPLHKPYYQLTEQQKALIWSGNRYFFGLNQFFEHLVLQVIARKGDFADLHQIFALRVPMAENAPAAAIHDGIGKTFFCRR